MTLTQALGIAAATLVTFGAPIARDFALPYYALERAEFIADRAELYAEVATSRAAHMQWKSDESELIGDIEDPEEARDEPDSEAPACAHLTPWL